MKLFKSTATRSEILETNGDFNLDEIHINSKITEELNSNYMLEATFVVTKNVFDIRIYDNIVEEAVIKIDDEHGEEFFVISKIRKTRDRIEVMCRHILEDRCNKLFLKDVRPTNDTGQQALTKILNQATGRRKDFFVSSNISKVNTSYFINKSMTEALYTADNSFVDRWGGETLKRQFNLTINDTVGSDRGVEIRSKKNLKGFEINSNLDELTTRILPRGYDGIEANYVDSPLINNYADIYTKILEFNDVKVKSENDDEGFNTLQEAQAEMRKRSEKQYSIFNVDKIQATYTIDFIELSKTEEYKNYVLLEKVAVGDTITVKEDVYNTSLKARVIKRVYSPKQKRRIETKVSNVKQGYTNITVESIIKELEEIKNSTSNPSLSDYINSMINAGLKDSYIVLKPNELLIMDSKDIDKAVNVTRYNKNGSAFSTNGYYGDYTYGFTIDGKLNGNLIEANTIRGDSLKANSITANKISIEAKKEIADEISGEFVTQTNFEVGIGEIKSTISESSEGNLITNGGFEYGSDSWTKIGTVSINTTQTYKNLQGKTALVVGTKGQGAYQDFKCVVGKDYTVNYYVAIDIPKSGKAVVGLTGKFEDVIPTDGEWHNIKRTFKASAETERFYFSCQGDVAVGFYIDNIMINRGKTALIYSDKQASQSFVEEKLSSTSIINSVNQAIEGTGAIKGTYTKLDKNSFSVGSSGSQSKVVISNGGIETFNSQGKPSFQLKGTILSVYDFDREDRESVGKLSSVQNYTTLERRIMLYSDIKANAVALGYLSPTETGVVTTQLELRRNSIGFYNSPALDLGYNDLRLKNINYYSRGIDWYPGNLWLYKSGIGMYGDANWLRLNLKGSADKVVANNGGSYGGMGSMRASVFEVVNSLYMSRKNNTIAAHQVSCSKELFTDIGHSCTDDKGYAIIYFDNNFKEFADTNAFYFITYDVMGINNKIVTKSKNKDCFEVEGTANTEFSYKIECSTVGANSKRYDNKMTKDYSVSNELIEANFGEKNKNLEKKEMEGLKRFKNDLKNLRRDKNDNYIKDMKEMRYYNYGKI